MALDIYKRRKELDLTLEEVAAWVGVGKSTVKKWESGYIKNMRRDKIIKLSEILKVSPLEILRLADDGVCSPAQSFCLTDEKLQSYKKLLESFLGKELPEKCVTVIKGNQLFLLDSASDFCKNIMYFLK